jgi:hypothetical protein
MVLLTLFACASEPELAPNVFGERAVDEVDENVARLRALQVFEVEGVVTAEQAAAKCGPYEPMEEATPTQKQAMRLASLADSAELSLILQQSDDLIPADDACDRIDENLDALDALDIVFVGDLVFDDTLTDDALTYDVCTKADQLDVIVQRTDWL